MAEPHRVAIRDLRPIAGAVSLDRESFAVARGPSALRRLLAAFPDRFRLNREIRPYEWGWLLYATAIEGGTPPAGHIV